MPPYAPKYVRPGEREQSRARLIRRLIVLVLSVPLVFVFLAFGYSDQAPAFLRSAIVTIDRALGYPIIGLLSLIVG